MGSGIGRDLDIDGVFGWGCGLGLAGGALFSVEEGVCMAVGDGSLDLKGVPEV